ncbi:hypothetical protein RCJ22_20245 [Vibrio sp. FNV 38]|nr:hypothetical protein [Vibrio sp. FNV 38]
MAKMKEIALGTAAVAICASCGIYTYAKSKINNYRVAVEQGPLLELAGKTIMSQSYADVQAY